MLKWATVIFVCVRVYFIYIFHSTLASQN